MKLKSKGIHPEETRVRTLFVEAINRGDLDAAGACFLSAGCLVTPDATAIYGRARIRLVLAQLLARRVRIEVEMSSALRAGDVALVRERWKVRSAGVNGSWLEQSLSPTLILRQSEGEWRLAVAALWV